MSFTARRSTTTRPFAYIRSLLRDRDAIHDTLLHLEPDDQAGLRQLFAQQRKEDEGLGVMKRVKKKGGQLVPLGHERKKERHMSLEEHQQFEPVVDPKQPLRAFLFGTSGSGKSYMAAMLAEDYHRHHPQSPIYLFSLCDEDPAFDDMKYIQRIPLDVETLQDLSIAKFRSSLIILDDCDQLPDPELNKVMMRLLTLALELGRKQGISVISSSHYPFQGKKTGTAKREANMVAFYPGAGEQGMISKWLSASFGMTKPEIQHILDTCVRDKSKWCVLYTNAPRALLTERSAQIL